MPRKPRYYLPHVPAHVMQRGHNKEPIFFEQEDYHEYLKILKKAADYYECQIHAYVLMTNHVHLLITPTTKNSISLMFQSIGRMYVTYINKTYQRSGTLWEGRHKGNIIETERYFITCMKYIESNPVRASMVKFPDDYAWSSYMANALGKTNSLLTPHKIYLTIASDKVDRLNRYKALFCNSNEDACLNIGQALESGTPLGDQVFLNKIEKVSKIPVGYIKRGRPQK